MADNTSPVHLKVVKFTGYIVGESGALCLSSIDALANGKVITYSFSQARLWQGCARYLIQDLQGLHRSTHLCRRSDRRAANNNSRTRCTS